MNAKLENGVRPADVARIMGCKAKEMTRVFYLGYATKFDTIAAALDSMGYELEIIVLRCK
ncbi:hypothetical protein [Delftia acidovorans]|uniref:hypothetical protein n=1 Tax=Delftia acidovorans TaxID=80866 RepID=UPI003D0D064B